MARQDAAPGGGDLLGLIPGGQPGRPTFDVPEPGRHLCLQPEALALVGLGSDDIGAQSGAQQERRDIGEPPRRLKRKCGSRLDTDQLAIDFRVGRGSRGRLEILQRGEIQ